MVTSYYIMKMTKNRQNINTEEYYSGLQSAPKLAVNSMQLKCRVCLQGGDIPIINDENFLDIREALKNFGDIIICDDYKNTTQLCYVCYKFLKSAILFRKIAHQTNKALRKPLKLEHEQIKVDYLETIDQEKLNKCSNSDNKIEYFPPRKKEWPEPIHASYSESIDDNKSNDYLNQDIEISPLTARKTQWSEHTKDDYSETNEDNQPNKYFNNEDKIKTIPLKKKGWPKLVQDINLEDTEENNSDVYLSNHDDGIDLFPPKKVEPKIKCHTCNKTYSKRYYKIHLTLHNPDHSNQFVCDICGRSFRLRDSCYNHRLRHRPDYFYKCQQCPFKARYMGSLRSHMRTHTHKHRFTCTECPAKFLYKSNLKTHVLLKHKDPQFKCDKCDKAFHTKDYLQKHIDVDHLGIKRHVCTVCGLAFGIRSALMKHQLRVHKREKIKQNYSKRSIINKAIEKNNK